MAQNWPVPFRPRAGLPWSSLSQQQQPARDPTLALEGLRSASQPALESAVLQRMGGSFLPSSEVSRLAGRDPSTVSPGANAYWANIMKTRLGEEEAARSFERKQQEAVQGAMTAQHPAVQALQETRARQAAYPAEAQGQRYIEAARIGGIADIERQREAGESAREVAGINARGRLQASVGNLQARQASRDAAIASAAMRALQLQQTPTTGERPGSPAALEREAHIQKWLDIIDLIRQGQFYSDEALYDMFEDEEEP